MADDEAVAAIMRAYAADAVSYADRRFGIALDYSENSLGEIDRILAGRIEVGLLVPDELSESEQEKLWVYCKMLGGYVGEVIIRNLGGTWQLKTLDNGGSSVQLLTGEILVSPPEAVWRTLTETFRSMASYYRGLRALLGQGRQTIEHGVTTVHLPAFSVLPPGSESRAKGEPWWKPW